MASCWAAAFAVLMSVVLITRDVKKDCSSCANEERRKGAESNRRKVMKKHRLEFQPSCAERAETLEQPAALTHWLVRAREKVNRLAGGPRKPPKCDKPQTGKWE